MPTNSYYMGIRISRIVMPLGTRVAVLTKDQKEAMKWVVYTYKSDPRNNCTLSK